MCYLQSCILCKHELQYLLRYCTSLLAPSLKLAWNYYISFGRLVYNKQPRGLILCSISQTATTASSALVECEAGI